MKSQKFEKICEPENAIRTQRLLKGNHVTKMCVLVALKKIRKITTTGLAGGLFWPYKGPLPALESKDSSKGSPAATSFT